MTSLVSIQLEVAVFVYSLITVEILQLTRCEQCHYLVILT